MLSMEDFDRPQLPDAVAALYVQAPRFDEGVLYHSAAYARCAREKSALFDALVARYGLEIAPWLENYAACFYAEMELEAQHFFTEGFHSGTAV